MVDAEDSKSFEAIRVGSSPTMGTIFVIKLNIKRFI